LLAKPAVPYQPFRWSACLGFSRLASAPQTSCLDVHLQAMTIHGNVSALSLCIVPLIKTIKNTSINHLPVLHPTVLCGAKPTIPYQRMVGGKGWME